MISICSATECTGCSACFSICPKKAISMVPDQEGFLHPQIDQVLCIDCNLCTQACSALHEPERGNRLSEELFFAAYHQDEAIRMSSSSGGAFSALASWMLQQGGYVCAAAYDDDFKGVKHIIVHSEEEMPRLRTSKYTQSRIGACFNEIRQMLRKGQKILFVGTPCQTSGLHLFLKKEYAGLLTVDIVCHGVPSPVVFADYISYLERKHGAFISNYSFRDKKWSWYHFNTKAEFKNRRSPYLGTWEEDVFMRGFLRDYFLRESCYACKYSKHQRYADITLSDFWGYHSSDGGFEDDDKGISMCMCNTEEGKQAFEAIKPSLVWCVRPREMSLCNGGFSPRLATREERKAFLEEYRRIGFEEAVPKYMYPEQVSDELKVLYFWGRGHSKKFLKRSRKILRFMRKIKRIFKKAS
ncbi:Coenzyme F420 hydrogenase/dehydrogenase, beta subunit C-terminal domain [Akkermansia muciniphila]|uniref:Coenzyme F420 hydrogenase/dehydrogenase, beta subunit C-terminal domain n=1 Tax=Akkermansia muciniphila TaxID=239935 RepID=UPI0033B99950